MNVYLTEIQAVSPITNEIMVYEGVRVYAYSEQEAQRFLNQNGYGYCRVVGKLVGIDFMRYEFSKN